MKEQKIDKQALLSSDRLTLLYNCRLKLLIMSKKKNKLMNEDMIQCIIFDLIFSILLEKNVNKAGLIFGGVLGHYRQPLRGNFVLYIYIQCCQRLLLNSAFKNNF